MSIEAGPGAWTVEDNRYTVLDNKVSRVYTLPSEERMNHIYNKHKS